MCRTNTKRVKYNTKIAKTVKIILSCLMVLSIFTITGCNNSVDTNKDGKIEVTERKIMGMGVEAYTSTIKGMVEAIYAPKSENDFQNVINNFERYATANVHQKFTAVAPDFEYETFNSEIVWKYAIFGDKRYQPDETDRLYFEFEVVRNYKHYPICLEFTVGDDGLIYNYSVYN